VGTWKQGKKYHLGFSPQSKFRANADAAWVLGQCFTLWAACELTDNVLNQCGDYLQSIFGKRAEQNAFAIFKTCPHLGQLRLLFEAWWISPLST